MLTRKDFKAIAEIIEINTVNKTSKSVIYKLGLINHLCKWLATQNPRFDGEKFRDACGLK